MANEYETYYVVEDYSTGKSVKLVAIISSLGDSYPKEKALEEAKERAKKEMQACLKQESKPNLFAYIVTDISGRMLFFCSKDEERSFENEKIDMRLNLQKILMDSSPVPYSRLKH
jgi:hypothetical protein